MQTTNKQLIVMAQEPWINGNNICGIDEKLYKLHYTKNATSKPRACIITTQTIDAVLLPQFSTSDICTIKTQILTEKSNEEMLLSSVYMPYECNDHVPDLKLREIIEHSENTGIPLVICADSNAHHVIWGSTNTNSRGEKLMEYIATTKLETLNHGTKPTFVVKNRKEVIDITLSSQNFASRIKNWQVSKEETLSDHKEINFSITIEQQPKKLFRNPRNTNWEIFNRNLSAKLRNNSKLNGIETARQLDDAVEFITNSMSSAFFKACPGRISKPKSNFWWNNELEKLKKESRRLNKLHEAKIGTTEEHNSWVILNKCKHKYSAEIRAAKKGTWINFCNQIEGVSVTARMHKLIANDKTKGPGILQYNNGSYTENAEDTAKLLLETHFPECINVDENSQHSDDTANRQSRHNLKIGNQTQNALDSISKILTKEKIEWAIFSFDKYKSPDISDHATKILGHLYKST